MKRSWWAYLALASLIGAWSAGVDGARPRYGGTIRAEIASAWTSLDPAAWPDDPTAALDKSRVLPLVFETLVGLDRSGHVVPRIATSWRRNPRGTRWEFQIRPGVRLHDGSLLDPAKAAAAMRRANPAWAAAEEAGALVLEVPTGANGLEWDLADPRYAIAVMSDSGLVGTGPFRIERWEQGRPGLLRAHDGYWGGRPFVDAVQVEFGRRMRDQLADLEQGRADIVTVLPQDVRRLSQRGLRLASSAARELVALVFDTSGPAAANAELRRALALSIDRAALCNVLLQRQGEPAHALVPQWLSGYAFLAHPAEDRATARTIVQAIPAAARSVQAQVEPADAIVQAIAERLTVDAHDAGLNLVMAPWRAGAHADARVVRRTLAVSSPDRVFAALVRALGLADALGAAPEEVGPNPPSPLELQAEQERSLVDRHLVIPLVHLPQLYGVSQRLMADSTSIIDAAGSWRLHDAWFRPE